MHAESLKQVQGQLLISIQRGLILNHILLQPNQELSSLFTVEKERSHGLEGSFEEGGEAGDVGDLAQTQELEVLSCLSQNVRHHLLHMSQRREGLLFFTEGEGRELG